MDDATSDDRAGSKSGTGIGQPTQWVLLTGNRFAIAAVLSAALGTSYLVLSISDVARWWTRNRCSTSSAG